jgi:hypothetical protein|tara:strand:+ start:10571 stop:10708 length:138 start_codon:yes stop_codon:yes gene_type:complete
MGVIASDVDFAKTEGAIADTTVAASNVLKKIRLCIIFNPNRLNKY